MLGRRCSCGPLLPGACLLEGRQAPQGPTSTQPAAHPLQVKEILVEESNVQPVNSPVTVRAAAGGRGA